MKNIIYIFCLVSAVLISLIWVGGIASSKTTITEMPTMPKNTKIATFAGGCFWCTESDFEKLDGVIEAVSGYTGGKEINPTYKQVSSGLTGHLEAVRIHYNPEVISYKTLLEKFWRHINPTDAGGQFVDRGGQYKSAVFYHDDEQKKQAEASKNKLAGSGRFDSLIVTEIVKSETFYPAEAYHQDYHKKNPLRYKYYRRSSGRDAYLKKTWGEDLNKIHITSENSVFRNPAYIRPDDETLKKRLTPLQYRVTRKNGTEPPFQNAYWNNKKKGIYVDIISGEPLFSSLDKYDSKTGWPSFTGPLEPDNIVEKKDTKFFMSRTEIRSRHGDSHLGHLFNDGPDPDRLRYCINSAALRFIPFEDLEKEGYGRYSDQFE